MHRRILFLGLTPILATYALFRVAGLRINTSASLPIGLYITSLQGAFVELCPDDQGLSAQRGYRHHGVCPDGAAPLLKPVTGKAGDEILLSSAGIAVNGKLLPNSAPLDHDSAGRPLTHWPFGRFRVASGTLWVASSYNSRSYDSRYLGPIREGAVRTRLRPLITW
ncbi:MAG TPA: conjugative transfer signal peptidase TraF [Bryobacteraceae bacterium]|jgi:conjugative transfer signal peptidase TraF|nr:conjugative transfer signal peptidase TraF [Bryobacteraceae bacterium]